MVTTSVKKNTQKSLDGLKNILTGLGIAGKDKRLSGEFYTEYLSESEIESIYQSSDVAQTFIDTLPTDMTREGFTISIDGSDEYDDEVQEELQRLDFYEKSCQAMIMARLYGGSCLYVIAGGGSQATPLTEASLKKIDGLQVLTKRDLRFTEVDTNPISQNYGFPLKYIFNNIEIHHTRMIRFDGKILPYYDFVNNARWHDSHLCAFKNPLRNYISAFDSVGTTLQDYIVPVVKMKDLGRLLQAGREAEVKARVLMLQKSVSPVNTIILDQEEEYDRLTADVTGLDSLLDRMENRLVSASRMPHTMILGSGPGGGLKGNGESEKRDWYDTVKGHQTTWFKKRVVRMLNLIFSQKEFEVTKGVIPDRFKITFNPLWQITLQERAEINKTQSEADERNIRNQVLTPGEVANSRFGGEFSLETTLEDGLRSDFDVLEEEEPKADKSQKKPKNKYYKKKM